VLALRSTSEAVTQHHRQDEKLNVVRAPPLQIPLLVVFAGFLTTSAAAQSSSGCARCHLKIWQTYQQTGMGRSFYRPSPATTIEDFSKDNTYYHQPSDSYFTMLRREGKYYQRRHQLDSLGKQINVIEKPVDYILGSGNHARTFLSRTTANTLIELPLGWYAEKGGYWAMNPGYDRPHHDGFRRPITYDCMFCHNAYPQIPADNVQPFADAVYTGPLPEGIDCQRCHGAGIRHAQLAGTKGTKPEAIRAAIVNPARLSTERQMEGCMVCHLETTSFPLPNALQRFERAAFSYRPGEPLAGFLLNFDHAPDAGREDKFEIVNAAYRLRRSACFLKSANKLLCTTCHNPHDIPRAEKADQHYTAACRRCHAQAFDRIVQAGQHTTANGCVACHMPKRRTEDVVHVVATDHFIQRRLPPGDLLADRAEHQDTYRGRVVPYYPAVLPVTAENQLTLAVAQVIQRSNMTEGIAQLTAAIEKYKPVQAGYYLQLADALQASGQPAKALPVYLEAVRHSPKSAVMLRRLGTALRQSARYAEAVEVLKQSTRISPEAPVAWHELGLAYRSMGKTTEAISAIGKALQLDSDLPEAHNNLGSIWFTSGDQTRAESAFREAIRIRPDYADAHGNLAGVLSGSDRVDQAKAEFETALGLRPADAATRYNYAMLLGRTGQYDEAQHELESTLSADPQFTDAHVLLADLLMARGQPRAAAPHYEQALRSTPDSGRAHLGLAAALLSLGDRAAAVQHLRVASTGADPAIRDQAAEILRQLNQ
jgi:tetratricopeptide (TPR) repeat protein